ncbi:hypothetical protein BFW38_09215 [Terasakiispira papahanaumokuakeensis]|uniref:Sulfurtransferase TusB n=1 Tax=Terasakiispira papahanaumokuakeensis TaxID=197479 RepID=A0A1E2VAL5_9GAMM|nr:sulfurtransferase complex subunit TusB [Terasakiispira papahanaumokuakeensis]ODC03695.1 hypothetical protein BFW38_09215 [Terasakiispira papahanaumokuakeensis]
MTTLHQIHRADRLNQNIVQWWQADDTLLLIEGAVVALTHAQWRHGLPEGIRVAALKDDIIARGLPLDNLPQDVTLLSDQDWVALTIQHDRVLSWS